MAKLISITDNLFVLNKDNEQFQIQLDGERTKLDECYRKPTFIDRILGKDLYICVFKTTPNPDAESTIQRYYIPKSLFEKYGVNKILSGDIDKYEVK